MRKIHIFLVGQPPVICSRVRPLLETAMALSPSCFFKWSPNVQWQKALMATLRNQSQEDHCEFKASYIVRLCHRESTGIGERDRETETGFSLFSTPVPPWQTIPPLAHSKFVLVRISLETAHSVVLVYLLIPGQTIEIEGVEASSLPSPPAPPPDFVCCYLSFHRYSWVPTKYQVSTHTVWHNTKQSNQVLVWPLGRYTQPFIVPYINFEVSLTNSWQF